MCKCKMAAICKFFVPVKEQGQIPGKIISEDGKDVKIYPPKKKGGRGGDRRAGRKTKGLTTKEEDIKRVRAILRTQAHQGRLTEEQMAALDSIGNTRSKDLRDVQKQQLLDIYYGPRRKKE